MFRSHPPPHGGARRRLWIAIATAAVFLATAAPVQAAQSAYVTDGENVFQFEIVAGGLLVPMTPAKVAAGQSPTTMAVSPDFESLYAVIEDSDSVSQYDIGRDGALSPKNPATVAAGGRFGDPHGVAVSPDGESVYVPVAGGDSVLQYDVGPGGELSPKSPPAVASGDYVFAVAVSPDGQSVYVTNYLRGEVWQYDVGPGGALSPKSPAMVSYPGDGAAALAVSPDGQGVYVPNPFTRYADGVWQYDVGPGGELSPKSPATVDAGFFPHGVAVSPDGGSVYVTNFGPSNDPSGEGSVSQYHVGAGGLLAPMVPPTVAAGEGSYGVAVSPDGESVYVANTGSGSVSQYDVGESGRLSPKRPATVATGTGGGAVGVAVIPGLVPTAKGQCKHGGWKRWGFRERGRCIPFVKRQARQSCHAARKVIGRRAFRKEYGKGEHHRRAMRRCIKQEIGPGNRTV